MSIITPRTAGFDLKKNHTCVKYKAYSNKLMNEHDLDRMKKNMMSCDVSHIETRDKGGLMWPKNNVNKLCGIAVTTFSNLLKDSKLMSYFNESATSSRVGLQVLRCMIKLKIQNHPMLKIPNSTCNNCKCDL